MKKLTVGVLLVLTAFASWQAASFAQNGAAPTIAFDITKAEIDYVLKNAPPNPPDRQLRVVDMGKYNLGVGIIHRRATNDKPGDPIPVIYHDFTPEVYIITSGSGVSGSFGTVQRPGGEMQVTFDGMPLYTYSGDSSPGQANGQGIQGIWFAVSASGGSAGGSSSGGKGGYGTGGY